MEFGRSEYLVEAAMGSERFRRARRPWLSHGNVRCALTLLVAVLALTAGPHARAQAVTVSFEESSYPAAESSSTLVPITLSEAPATTTTIGIAWTVLGTAFITLRGLTLEDELEFGPSDRTLLFEVNSITDGDEEDAEVQLEFADPLPAGIVRGTIATTTVFIEDDDVSLNFGSSVYTAVEGGPPAEVTVELSKPAPSQGVFVPFYWSHYNGANTADYGVATSTVVPRSVRATTTFFVIEPNATSGTFTVTVNDDDIAQEFEWIEFVLDAPSSWELYREYFEFADIRRASNRAATTAVRFVENEVFFGSPAYTAVEGNAPAEVTVELAVPADEDTDISLNWTHRGGATTTDYGLATSTSAQPLGPGTNATLTIPESTTSTSFTVTAVADFAADQGESLEFRFVVPEYIAVGATATTTVYLRDTPVKNVAPTFEEGARTMRDVAENTPSGRPFGPPVSASDANGDPLTYTLRGRHGRWFGIDAQTGQLRTSQSLNYESRSTYSITVMADDGKGGRATIDVTVNVTDVGGEVPLKPGPPTVLGVAGSPTSLSVRWYAPPNLGPRPMTYDLNWREHGSGGWPGTRSGLGRTSEMIDSLKADTWYEVRVRARNADGLSPWSWPARALTGEAEKPACDLPMPDVTVFEGETARFTVDIPPPLPRDDVLLWETRDYEAGARHGDFEYASGSVDLSKGTSKVEVAVKTNADNKKEPTERFQVVMRYASWNERPDWRQIAWCAITVHIRDGSPNEPPAFGEGAATRRVDENAPPGRALGKPFTAEDPDGDPLTYALEGADAASFAIDRNTGQLRTLAPLDHEARDAYAVVVKAEDDHGGEATIEVSVTVDDVHEQPATPAAPTVATTADRGEALDVSWTKPGLAGGPEIVGYVLRWGRGDDPDSQGVAREYPATARSARLDRLRGDTEYRVWVRALNGETPSEWSAPGSARTGGNRPPVFAEGARTTRSVAENATVDARWEPLVGEPVVAEDPEGDHVEYSLVGPDGDKRFRIDSQTGQLRARLSTVLNHEAKASYLLTVRAQASLARARDEFEDRDGGSAEIEVTVNVEDLEEPPGTPGKPRFWEVPGSATSVSLNWSPGENTGPRMVYDVRYRETGGGSWTEGPRGLAWTSADLTGLSAGVEYEAQARARSDEGQSDWSRSGTGSTDPDGAERSVVMADVSVHEGETARFTIEISPPPEAGDDLRLSWGTRSNRGEASAGQDFRAAGVSGIRLAAGQTAVTGEVVTLADNRDEGRERLRIAIDLHDVGGGDPSIKTGGSIWIEDGPRPASAGPSAWVAGDRLTLRYGDALDAGSVPGPKDWVVRAETEQAARTLAVAVASVSGREVVLELSVPAAAGESVSVSYLPWAMHPLRGADGAELAPLTELEARNETPVLAPAEAPEAALAPAPVVGAGAMRERVGPALATLFAGRPASSVVRLDLPERGLTDVSPLAAFTGLEVLDLHGNAVVDLWPLGALAKLRRLDLSHNRVEDVSALSGLQDLEVLLLDGNRVADALLLAELRSLARLDLAGNRLADAGPLGDLSRLVWLDLTGNPVSDPAPLGRLTALRWLWLDAGAAGAEALAPLRERPAPVRVELRPPAETGAPR